MSRTTARRTRRLATGLVALTATAGLTACGASLDAQTYQERIQEGSSNAAVGALAIRNVAVEPPRRGDLYEEGGDAQVRISVVNASPEADVLLEATSPAAEEVAILSGDEEGELEVPPLGSTRDTALLELRGLTRELRTGEYVELTLRFESAGTTELLVPIALTGESDRPVYTGEYEEGGEEPALQAPAGGHGEEDADEQFNEGVVEGVESVENAESVESTD